MSDQYLKGYNMSKTKLKNINTLDKNNKAFIDRIPYLGIHEYNDTTYFKCTGYHLQGKELKDLVPNGYSVTGIASFWNELKHTSINVVRLNKV